MDDVPLSAAHEPGQPLRPQSVAPADAQAVRPHAGRLQLADEVVLPRHHVRALEVHPCGVVRSRDNATGPALEAVIAFGGMAREAVRLWSGRPDDVTVVQVVHPSSRDEDRLLDEWRAAVTRLRDVVTPDDDGDATGPNYGSSFRESDHAPIPRRDLPFGAPAFLGDDAWVRASGRAQNSVRRPSDDDEHTLIWNAPRTDA